MAPISLKDNKIPVLIDKLIYQLTNFKKSSRNFTLSAQFALSNFRYHKYLDVNSHTVTRLIEGVVQKFEVHSQYVKAEAFQSLCETFLNTSLSETPEEIKTDVHYALISLLLVLSNTPINYDYIPRENTPPVTDDDDFDWREYLLGDADEEVMGIPHSGPSFDWSDDDLDSDALELIPASDSGIGQSSGDDQSVMLYDTTKCSISSSADKGRIWLAEHVVSQYWQDYPVSSNNISQNTSQSNQCSLARTWQTFQQNQNPFHQYNRSKLISETQLVRETIWMLSGVENSFVYKYHGKEMHVKDDIEVSHLTSESLQNLLTKFAKAGEQSYQLQQFKASILEEQNRDNTSPQPSMTIQAFANSLSRYFKEYKAFLSEIEKDIIKKELTVTLIGLQDKLGIKMKEIAALYSVYRDGVLQQRDTPLPQKVTHLLDTFYISLKMADALGASARWKVSVLLHVFLDTVRPCFEFIDSWVTSGTFYDPANEFFISRDEAVLLQSTLFWEKGIALRQCEVPGGSQASYLVPCFLSELLQQILLAGKSVNVIQGLGKMVESFVSGTKDGSLYHEFLHSFLSSLSSKREMRDDHQSGAEHKNSVSQEHIALARHTDILAATREIRDPMLKASLMSCTAVNCYDRHVDRLPSCLDKHIQSGLQQYMDPIEILYKQSLFPLLQAKCTKAYGTLMSLLKSECNLMEHLDAMKNFFLLEAGATMQHFYLDIFKKVRRRQPWQDISYLNSLLQEALYPRFPQFVDRLTISLSPNTTEIRQSGAQTLHNMTLYYKVPWPVSLVIDEFCLTKYNQVFLFLLTVKQVKWSLDSLRFTDLSGKTMQTVSSDEEDEEEEEANVRAVTPVNHQLMQKMYLLRFKLLHFVNSLHNYMMTRILHVTALEFKEAISKVKNLNDVIAEHRAYVEKVFERCLLSQKVGIIKGAITKVFNLVLQFQTMWDASVHELSAETLQKIDTEFSKCNHFLIAFLGNIVKRGSFPHLESLAFSLSPWPDK